MDFCQNCQSHEEDCICIKCRECGSVDSVEEEICEECGTEIKEIESTYSNKGKHE